MNANEFRRRKKLKIQYTKNLAPIPKSEWPDLPSAGGLRLQVWLSRKYLVQLFDESTPEYPGLKRLSINRVKQNRRNQWVDGLTWDELQQVKSDVGLGDDYAIEIYPPDRDSINAANMHHLWLIHPPLEIGWFKPEMKS